MTHRREQRLICSRRAPMQSLLPPLAQNTLYAYILWIPKKQSLQVRETSSPIMHRPKLSSLSLTLVSTALLIMTTLATSTNDTAGAATTSIPTASAGAKPLSYGEWAASQLASATDFVSAAASSVLGGGSNNDGWTFDYGSEDRNATDGDKDAGGVARTVAVGGYTREH